MFKNLTSWLTSQIVAGAQRAVYKTAGDKILDVIRGIGGKAWSRAFKGQLSCLEKPAAAALLREISRHGAPCSQQAAMAADIMVQEATADFAAPVLAQLTSGLTEALSGVGEAVTSGASRS